MKYMMMMNCPVDGYARIMSWPPEAFQAHIAFMKAFARELAEAGELVAAEGLASPTDAILVRADDDGRPITDGVFPETKEFLAGFWIVDVESPARAHQLAARASAAPGPDGKPLNMPIELRQVMSAPREPGA